MKKNHFVHLRVRSSYSLSSGIVRIPALCEQTAQRSFPAVALTEKGNVFSALKLQKSAFANGIKPIFGAELTVSSNAGESQLLLLVQNSEGFKNLSVLLSMLYQGLENNHSSPVLDLRRLRGHTDGLIALSCASEGVLGKALLSKESTPQQIEAILSFFDEHFGDRFYHEVQRTGRAKEDQYISALMEIAKTRPLQVVATNDVVFLNKEDFEAHEVKSCIAAGRTLDDKARPRPYSAEQYLKSEAEMVELFSDMPEAIENSIEIAKRCNFLLETGINKLPDFPTDDGVTTDQLLNQKSHEGLEQRFVSMIEGLAADKKDYLDRLKMELGVIEKMGFAGYFLVVADFIQWARDHDIPVGPGRGSGAGSIVAYALGITNLDPIRHDLLFERFLNPERVSMPDFDIDFCMDGRDRVIDYVVNKYGEDKVGQIVTFGTLAAKAAVRDVGRVLGFSYGFVDSVAKLIPNDVGISLEQALTQEERLQDRHREEPEVKRLIDLAMQVEGLIRQTGKHAAGVVIAPSTLTDFCPLYRESHEDPFVIQFDKDDGEAVGLVKFDFLGLTTLTTIDRTLKLVNADRAAQSLEPIDIDCIPLDDPKVYELISRGDTSTLFQLESRGMTELIIKLAPESFEEITSLVALYRPGPLQSGMVDDFLDRKHGRRDVAYPHPSLEGILKPTYGVILYQEQVMQIAQVLSNYSLGAADLLRRAMGKKKPKEMAEQHGLFVSGAVLNGVDKETAEFIFELVEKFSGYGFNRSHSAAYALIAYQTAYLKTYYPEHFLAVNMTISSGNTDKVAHLIGETESLGVKFKEPEINQCRAAFYAKDGVIYYGLAALKGLGEGVIEKMMQERDENGVFEDLFDFAKRVVPLGLNKKGLEALAYSGALDGLGPNRASIVATLPEALAVGVDCANTDSMGQVSLFGDDMFESVEFTFKTGDDIDPDYLLAEEYRVTGVYLSGHPMDKYQQSAKDMGAEPIASLYRGRQFGTKRVAGLIIDLRVRRTGAGDRMATYTLDDGSSRVDVVAFPDAYSLNQALLVKGNLVAVDGRPSADRLTGAMQLSTEKVIDLKSTGINAA